MNLPIIRRLITIMPGVTFAAEVISGQYVTNERQVGRSAANVSSIADTAPVASAGIVQVALELE